MHGAWLAAGAASATSKLSVAVAAPTTNSACFFSAGSKWGTQGHHRHIISSLNRRADSGREQLTLKAGWCLCLYLP